MLKSPRLNLQLNADTRDDLANLSLATGASRSAVACASIRTMAKIQRHGKGRALVLTEEAKPGDILLVPAL